MARTFAHPSMQTVYSTLLELAANPSSELYNKDGSQRTGANVRIAFWYGFNGVTHRHFCPPGSLLMAAYRAGQDFKKLSQKENHHVQGN